MGRRHCGCKSKCNCQGPKQIVYPVTENVQQRHTEERIQHIHPSHTTIMNNHTIRNEHVYPHTTSHQNRVREVNVGGVGTRPGNEGCHESDRRESRGEQCRCKQQRRHCHCRRGRRWY